MIGIVGGIGPYAGIHLMKCILDQTEANKDQDHIPIALLSFPEKIVDRTDFLLGKTTVNPAFTIVEIIKQLELIGADIIGIACNTSHSHKIFDVILEELRKNQSKIKLINIITQTIKFIKVNYPTVKRIGVLSTNGTYITNTYHDPLIQSGYEVIIPNATFQDNIIHKCIYDPVFGIKNKSNPISDEALILLDKAINFFQSKRAELIILGCTELSLAIQDDKIDNLIIIDSTRVLANALINNEASHKLKSFTQSYLLL
jgi:aspartate racemase